MSYKKKEKKSLLLYYDYAEQFKLLNDKQLRQLIEAMIEFDKNGVELKLDEITKMAFIPIKKRLIENKDNWEQVCENNSKNAKKRWNKKDSEDAIACDRMQTYADKEGDKEKDKEGDKDMCVCINTHPDTHTTVFNFCTSVFPNFNQDDLKKSCEIFFDHYDEKNWKGVNDWQKKLKLWIKTDINEGKIRQKQIDDDYVDEAGFHYKNGRRLL